MALPKEVPTVFNAMCYWARVCWRAALAALVVLGAVVICFCPWVGWLSHTVNFHGWNRSPNNGGLGVRGTRGVSALLLQKSPFAQTRPYRSRWDAPHCQAGNPTPPVSIGFLGQSWHNKKTEKLTWLDYRRILVCCESKTLFMRQWSARLMIWHSGVWSGAWFPWTLWCKKQKLQSSSEIDSFVYFLFIMNRIGVFPSANPSWPRSPTTVWSRLGQCLRHWFSCCVFLKMLLYKPDGSKL